MTAKILPFRRPVQEAKAILEIDELRGRIQAKTHKVLHTWREIKARLLAELAYDEVSSSNKNRN